MKKGREWLTAGCCAPLCEERSGVSAVREEGSIVRDDDAPSDVPVTPSG